MVDFLILLLLIVANGVFAMSEIAVVSAKKIRLEPLARQGNKAARAALQLMESPNRFLSTVQIGITLIGILAGAISGTTLAAQLAPYLAQIAWLAPYSEAVSLGLMVALVTYLSLVIGELVPKRLALNNPEGIAMRVAGPMRWLSLLALPVVRLLSLSTEGALRLLGVRLSTDPPVTEEEIKSLLRQGTEAGVFEQAEQQLARQALDLDDRRVSLLMTPRPDIVWLDVADSPQEIERKIVESGFSRLPVIEDSPDHVLGIVRTSDLLVRCTRGEPFDLREHIHKAVFIPASASAAQALELFRRSRLHTILVVDEYGGIEGLVTPTDVLEFIVGQLPTTQFADANPDIVQREDGSWLVDGLVRLHDLAQFLPEDNPFYVEFPGFHTLNGFILQTLAHIPSAGERFTWSGYRFEVVDMDGRRVDKVLVSVLDEDSVDPDAPDVLLPDSPGADAEGSSIEK